MIGKTDKSYLIEGLMEYEKRLKNYIQLEIRSIPDIKQKKLPEIIQKQKEGELILKNISNTDYVILLDESGKMKSSIEFARFLQERMNLSTKQLVFVIGGPYGFSDNVYKRSNERLSLSNMTFSHQMVRLIFVEQLYRTFTIIKREPYHHI